MEWIHGMSLTRSGGVFVRCLPDEYVVPSTRLVAASCGAITKYGSFFLHRYSGTLVCGSFRVDICTCADDRYNLLAAGTTYRALITGTWQHESCLSIQCFSTHYCACSRSLGRFLRSHSSLLNVFRRNGQTFLSLMARKATLSSPILRFLKFPNHPEPLLLECWSHYTTWSNSHTYP